VWARWKCIMLVYMNICLFRIMLYWLRKCRNTRMHTACMHVCLSPHHDRHSCLLFGRNYLFHGLNVAVFVFFHCSTSLKFPSLHFSFFVLVPSFVLTPVSFFDVCFLVFIRNSGWFVNEFFIRFDTFWRL